jgi:hypothetical protein
LLKPKHASMQHKKIIMEKGENKILVHEKILRKIEETCEIQSEKKKFNLNILSGELQYFFSFKLERLDRPLYRRINGNNNTDKGLHPSTISHAWKNEGKHDDGAMKDLRDLLCYYAFEKDWHDALKLIGTTEEEEKQRTIETKEEYKCKKEGKSYISKTETEIKQFAKRVYIELTTRKAGLPIDEKKDVIEEIYNSWHKLFCIIRDKMDILPISCFKNNENTESILILTNKILNEILRPHLTEHQAGFRSWLAKAKLNKAYNDLSPQELQKKFPDYKSLMKSLKETNNMLIESIKELYQIMN